LKAVVESEEGRGHEGTFHVLLTGLAVAGLVAGTPATAAPLDKGHFHDVFTESFTCETTGTPVQRDGDVHGNFLFNQRGPDLAYYRESLHGTDVYTNLDTGGTFTFVFSTNAKDHVITDNGDGTITILVLATGGTRAYDTNGNFVLNEPGQIRFSFDIDYNGTLSDPSDDLEVPGSFQVVRDSTGRKRHGGPRLLRGPGGVHNQLAEPRSCAGKGHPDIPLACSVAADLFVKVR
jgi:hypothetical protein